MPESDYTSVNVPFFTSIQIAKSPQEIKWVQRNYCQRLKQLWEAIPANEQAKHLSTNFGNVVKYPEVLAYCEVNN
ncbi:hypothetical protein AQB9606_03956 [Aquabacterium sp. CECT 9606]|nr:hypothetical protein AQB9606_03956 [Aquabacterium sp. CECT 9606]